MLHLVMPHSTIASQASSYGAEKYTPDSKDCEQAGRPIPHQLKLPKQEVKKHEYHSLRKMVLKDKLFSEEVGAHAALCLDRHCSPENCL